MNEIETEDVRRGVSLKGTAAIRLFDREASDHPWARAFGEMYRLDPGRRWVVAMNWRMDHRVSTDREAGDLQACGCFAEAAEAKSWWAARSLYFQEEVCRASDPLNGRISAYLRPTNGVNLIPEKVASYDELVHVGSLNAMLRWISRSDRAGDVDASLGELAGRGLPSRSAAQNDPDWFEREVADLAQALLSRGAEVIRRAAGLLADACGDTEPPWWASFAEEVHTALGSEGAVEICTALGLGHRTAGEWLLVWRYSAGEVGPIYRPTSVEANDSPYHFPSPPQYGFGITMPLKPSLAACREVLHRPLRGAAAVDRCTGKLLFLEKMPVSGDNELLMALRAEHRQRLSREFSTAGLNAWMERHPDPLS